jgi:hypothetical protein
MKTTEYPARETIANDLYALAARMREAADRIRNDDAVQAAQRDHEAAQMRLMAELAKGDMPLDVADAWATTAHALITAYDRTDMEAVHASRAARRDERAERIAAEPRRDIVLAADDRDGLAAIEAAKITRYVIVTPHTLDRARGVIGDRLVFTKAFADGPSGEFARVHEAVAPCFATRPTYKVVYL